METKIFENTTEDLNNAAELIKQGEVVVMPTETVYGLGANALDEKAVAKIFEAKGRPSDNPLIVHISDFTEIENYVADVPPNARKLAEKFWPGPLTMILKKKDIIPPRVSAGRDTVGIRIPENQIARDFIRFCGVPVAAPSANISGKPSPTCFEHVRDDMNGRVAGIIRGEISRVGVESTVIDLTSEIPTVLRPGGISVEQLREVLGEVLISSEVKKDDIPKAPGMKYKHYSPKASVYILSGSVEKVSEFLDKRRAFGKVAVMAFDEMKDMLPPSVEFLSLGSRNNPETAANRLFDCLRKCDKLDIKEAYAPEIPDDGLWRAVKNRLYKAAAGRIINAECAKSVLFVCTGNSCRSPLAEVIFNAAGKNGVASSAGLASGGGGASRNSAAVAKELGLDLTNHRSIQLDGKMFEAADLILTMTQGHKMSLPQSPKVFTLGEYAGTEQDVADPYGGDLDVYRTCAEEIKNLIEKIDL